MSEREQAYMDDSFEFGKFSQTNQACMSTQHINTQKL